MNAALLFTIVFAVVLAVADGALPRAKKRAFLQECEDKLQTGLDIDEILDKWLLPTTNEGKCLMECYAFKKGLVDENADIDHATATPHFEESFPCDPESVKKAEQSLAKCDEELDMAGLDNCSKGVEVLRCFRKNAKEIGLEH